MTFGSDCDPFWSEGAWRRYRSPQQTDESFARQIVREYQHFLRLKVDRHDYSGLILCASVIGREDDHAVTAMWALHRSEHDKYIQDCLHFSHGRVLAYPSLLGHRFCLRQYNRTRELHASSMKRLKKSPTLKFWPQWFDDLPLHPCNCLCSFCYYIKVSCTIHSTDDRDSPLLE